jgi:hypothetical protein
MTAPLMPISPLPKPPPPKPPQQVYGDGVADPPSPTPIEEAKPPHATPAGAPVMPDGPSDPPPLHGYPQQDPAQHPDGLHTPPMVVREPLPDMSTVDLWLEDVQALHENARNWANDPSWPHLRRHGEQLQIILESSLEPSARLILIYLRKVEAALHGRVDP